MGHRLPGSAGFQPAASSRKRRYEHRPRARMPAIPGRARHWQAHRTGMRITRNQEAGSPACDPEGCRDHWRSCGQCQSRDQTVAQRNSLEGDYRNAQPPRARILRREPGARMGYSAGGYSSPRFPPRTAGAARNAIAEEGVRTGDCPRGRRDLVLRVDDTEDLDFLSGGSGVVAVRDGDMD